MLQQKVPFFGNSEDDTHCYQAAIKMVVKYFWPDEDYSFEQLDEITHKVKDLWTWPTAGLLWLREKGAEVQVVEMFDYEQFVSKGEDYLLEFYGKEVGTKQIQHSDIEQEIALIREAITVLDISKKVPGIEELIALLDKGYLVICNVNSMALNTKAGYVGHFVVLIGHDDEQIILHDPGLPPLAERGVTFPQFETAWAYPNETAKNYMAIKYK